MADEQYFYHGDSPFAFSCNGFLLPPILTGKEVWITVENAFDCCKADISAILFLNRHRVFVHFMEDAAHYIGAVDEFAAVDDYPYSNRGCGCHGHLSLPGSSRFGVLRYDI